MKNKRKHTHSHTSARTHTESSVRTALHKLTASLRAAAHCAPPAARGARRVHRSGSRLAAQTLRCGCCRGGPQSPAPRGGVFRPPQPPSPEELRPALQHGGGGRGGGGRAAVGPALTAVPGVATPPRLRESARPPPGPHAALRLRSSEPGVFGAIYPKLSLRDRPAPANPYAGRRGGVAGSGRREGGKPGGRR